MSQTFICVRCKGEYEKDPSRKIQALMCPACRAEVDEAAETELAQARIRGYQEQRRKAWKARLFDQHRNGKHRVRKPGCEPCRIREAVDSVVLEDTDEIPRALR